MNEIWKTIENYETYSVSTFGNVRNDTTGKILKGTNDNLGRLSIEFNRHNDNRKRIRIHRLVALTFIENPENKAEVDHIDNNPSNNHIENLRWATRQENIRNTRIPSTNTSGVKGVYWRKDIQKWSSNIKIDRIQINIGCYNTIEEATLARQTRANEAFGVFVNACESMQP